MEPQFFYFDMGNVLVRFSHERMAEQMAAVSGTTTELARRVLFADQTGLHWAYERGELSRESFYQQFCDAAGVPLADIDRLDTAGSDIFELDPLMIGLVGRLAGAGHKLGILSNTTQSHWRHCIARFGALTTLFSVHALSHKIGAMKPSPAIYQAAASLAGTPPNRIFFTDDRPDNVTAARQAGFDAVLYESVSQLNQALRQRQIKMNY